MVVAVADLRAGHKQVFQRIFVVHLTIVLGMGAVAFFGAPGALFGLFAVLKTLVDLGGVLPPREAGTDPPWLLRPLDRIESPEGEGFSAHWRRTRAAELAQREAEREANERVVDGLLGDGLGFARTGAVSLSAAL